MVPNIASPCILLELFPFISRLMSDLPVLLLFNKSDPPQKDDRNFTVTLVEEAKG